MPLHAACKARVLLFTTLAIVSACASRPPPANTGTPSAPVVAQPTIGQPYAVVGSESLIIIRVYRGGTLANAGHNHIVASHNLAGSIHVTQDLTHSSCEVSFPVAQLTVDEAELRAAEGPDFTADVSDSARDGTKEHMLGPALLDAAAYPNITMRCNGFDADGEHLRAHLQIEVRGHRSEVTVPVSYTLNARELLVQGELPLKQTDLGLTPFTAMLGALAVRDQMQLGFRIVARAP
jgi:polyisoprenoid-binding protein YceI